MSEDIVVEVTKCDLFSRFVKERVRLPETMDERLDCLNDPITINKIKTIVTAWKKEARVEINSASVIDRLSRMFGEPVDQKYWRIKVFATRGQAIDWDDEHS